ncbi:glycoside hydrolase family 2 [Halovivax sp.]|uniref:glycoside hydrolase family 2 n=1 Tax=Halovivax sp. TaxID=1935978 RepID=UPI0025B84152|nr:glycoside hydrolase family 2 [Halovivax sp.]
MAGKWSGGVVESTDDEAPPSVAEWEPVTVPGRSSQFVDAAAPIAYRRRFPDPRRVGTERAIVEFRGVRGHARVWINDEYLGDHDCPFTPARFEFDPREENELVIVCEPSAATAAIESTAAVADAAVPGIRGGVSVSRRPPSFLRDLRVRPRLTDDRAVLDATLVVDAGESIADSVTFSLRPEGFRGGGSMARATVEGAAGERVRVEKRIEVRDPSLWWPGKLGPQHRYTLRAKFGDDSIERSVGFRRIERDEGGFVVNGHRLRARGLTVLPDTADQELVDRAAEANANLLRFPAHVPPSAVYDACDEAGLLVWQGLPEPSDGDQERAAATGERMVEHFDRHPSFATLGIREIGPDPFDSPLGSGLRAKLAIRWRAWRADAAGSWVAVESTLPPHVDAIPVTGPPGTDADAWAISPGWGYLDPSDVEWLLERYPAIARAAVGFGAATVRDDAGVDDDAGIGELDARVLRARGLNAESSRTHQVAVLKTVAESLRRRGCGIVVADALADASSDGGRGVIDAEGTAKPAYEALAESFEPIQTVVDGRPTAGETATLHLVNDTAAAVEAAVRWHAGDRDGSLAASADAYARTEVGTVSAPRDADELLVELVVGDRRIRNRYPL